jgi:hypothetical protein
MFANLSLQQGFNVSCNDKKDEPELRSSSGAGSRQALGRDGDDLGEAPADPGSDRAQQ